ncbi:hypothetical protein N7582_005877 [Saccharomyces uvarum]|uniref:Flavodoxin-like fold domain-containing protein n=1 Tax=Saccharomyces uvarum TaxID=230603 RepID=A0AA35JBK2_SACUV|nr:hypothetical protein N7582_005877 [Saccharomyces uvarum]CAI4054018.1 hypothetical protein SUVC_16G4590 [Saccharomyces uvarum]
MKVLIVLAHPEKHSLTSSLAREAKETFEARGDEVRVSDLYSMMWKSNVDRDDFPQYQLERLFVCDASKKATKTNTLTEDVLNEQEKLLWCDALIFVFPIWWFSMPAILKGWVERVFSFGFGYGVGVHDDTHWGDRYGEGVSSGKRAMIITVAGGWKTHYSARGVSGPIEDILFPINHGMLFYTGFDVLQPFVVYRGDSLDEESFGEVSCRLKERINSFNEAKPISYRSQNGGDYTIPALELKDSIKSGHIGYRLHVKNGEFESKSHGHV